jgi:hypothetical protein
MLLVASVVALLPGIAFGADDPAPTSEAPSEGNGEMATDTDQEQEKKGFWSRFKDPEDGKLDIMAQGEQKAGFFPIAIPFNEPAIGVGLVLALGYFHPQKAAGTPSPDGKMAPPTATFGAGVASTNGTWAAAAGHHHVFKDDSIRYLGVLGGGSVNLTFYGFGDQGTSEDEGRDFNIELLGTVQQSKFRIAKSPFFIGAKYVYATTKTTWDTAFDYPLEGDTQLAGVSALFEYDTRDTVFTPNKGLKGSLELSYYAEALGGDFNYGSAKLGFRYYWALAEAWTLGFRIDYDAVGDEAPFYALSWVKLRGVPAFRYLGHYVATFETEPRYKIGDRWSVVAFAGMGRAAQEASNLKDADKVYNYGGGFRYLIARKMGLGMGIDIARGPEDTVVYLTIGSAW